MSKAPPLSCLIAQALLRIKAVIVSPNAPFTYASGMRGPVYCDNRLVLSYPADRRLITDAFEREVRQWAQMPDAIAAVATAGIPHGAWLAQRLDLPMAYVRSKPKGHGRENLVEGVLRPGQRTVLLEDLVTSGGSSLRAVEAVRSVTGIVPEAVLCIFTYNYPGTREKFSAAGVPLVPLCDFDTLLHVAQSQSLLSTSQLDTLRRFQADPIAWSNEHLPAAQ